MTSESEVDIELLPRRQRERVLRKDVEYFHGDVIEQVGYREPQPVYVVSAGNEVKHLTRNSVEMHGCVVSTVATDAPVLKHQAISIHSAD